MRHLITATRPGRCSRPCDEPRDERTRHHLSAGSVYSLGGRKAAAKLYLVRVKWMSRLFRSTPSTFQPAEIHASAWECDSVLAHHAR